MKMWRKEHEWTQYANCKNSLDHTLPDVRTEEDADRPVADPLRVKLICDGCRVRPECVSWAVGPQQPTEVWCAGRFIPVDKRKARKVRVELKDSLSEEFTVRGEDV